MENDFLVGGIRWGNKAGCYFVIFPMVGRCGVPISLIFGAGGLFREWGMTEDGGRRKGERQQMCD